MVINDFKIVKNKAGYSDLTILTAGRGADGYLHYLYYLYYLYYQYYLHSF